MLFKSVEEARQYVQENQIESLETWAIYDCLGFCGYSTIFSPLYAAFKATFKLNNNGVCATE